MTDAMVPMAPAPLILRGRRFDAGRPAVMAIINRTNDSFYAAGRHADVDTARRALDSAVALGADIIDVGGVRAGQEGPVVTPKQEIGRVVPFLEHIRATHPEVIISLDTWRSEVAQAAAHCGVDLINDTWAGADPELVQVAADIGAAVVCSHTGGLPPRTDPVAVSYPPEPLGIVADVLATLQRGAEVALAAGIPRERILVDPTLDFGKTTAHSLTTLRHTAAVVALGFPVLQALSRKDFVGETLDLPAGWGPPCSARTMCAPPGGWWTWSPPFEASVPRPSPCAGYRRRCFALRTVLRASRGRYRCRFAQVASVGGRRHRWADSHAPTSCRRGWI